MSWKKKSDCSIINESSVVFLITFTASVVPEDVKTYLQFVSAGETFLNFKLPSWTLGGHIDVFMPFPCN